jgi:transcriptional regulator with XRE-family HTH domain
MATKRTDTTPSEGLARGSQDVVLAGKVGAAIIAARHPDITQAELARRTGIDQPTVSKLERGLRPTPITLWEMLAIEQATGRPPGWILSRSGITNPTHGLDIAAAVNADADLTSLARRMLLAAIDAAHAEVREHPHAANNH